MAVKIRNTENFDTLRQAGGYYVDKTGFLEKFLVYPSETLWQDIAYVHAGLVLRHHAEQPTIFCWSQGFPKRGIVWEVDEPVSCHLPDTKGY